MYWEMIWMYCQEYLTYDIVWQATTVEIDLIRSPKNEYIMNIYYIRTSSLPILPTQITFWARIWAATAPGRLVNSQSQQPLVSTCRLQTHLWPSSFSDAQAHPAPTLVSPLVGPSHLQIFTLSASLDHYRASVDHRFVCQLVCNFSPTFFPNFFPTYFSSSFSSTFSMTFFLKLKTDFLLAYCVPNQDQVGSWNLWFQGSFALLQYCDQNPGFSEA